MLLSSCSELSGSEQDLKIKVSKKLTSVYGNTGLTSESQFPVSYPLESRERLLVFNIFTRGVDTLNFEGDEISVKRGKVLESEGPQAIDSFNYFIKTGLGMVYIDPRHIIIQKENEIEKLKTFDFDLLEDKQLLNLAGGVSFNLDHFFKGYNSNEEKIYFFLKDGRTSSYFLCELGLEDRNLRVLPNFVDDNLVNENDIIWRGKGILSKNNMPFVFYTNQKLLLSYNYSNEIVIVDLRTEKSEVKAFIPEKFPARKKRPNIISDDMDFMEATVLMDYWDFDVSYGAFEQLPNEKGFCRLVRGATLGENQTNPQLFLEVFNSELDKIGELNLTEIEPDLSTLYFMIDNRLFFKAKAQPDENKINYYFVSIDY